MPQTLSRALKARWRVPFLAACASLALAGGAPAADLRPLRLVVGATGGHALRGTPSAQRPPVEPGPEIGLLERIALFLDAVFSTRAVAAPLAYAPPPAPGPLAVEIVPYPGPLPAGTVIVNLERRRVYRVLGGGWAERYQEASLAAVLARVGMVR